MCIIHKGSRGFQASYPALVLGSKLIGLKPEFPYEIHTHRWVPLSTTNMIDVFMIFNNPILN